MAIPLSLRIGVLLFSLLLQDLVLHVNSLGEGIADSPYDRTETRGNQTLGCTASGPCTACSYSEKNDDETYHCSVSGYRQSYRCVEITSENAIEKLSNSLPNRKMGDLDEDNENVSHSSIGARKVEVTVHDEQPVIHLYFSCLPTGNTDRLSVWGFEAIVLGLLGISAPVIYHRRKRNAMMSGMTRIPTSSRF